MGKNKPRHNPDKPQNNYGDFCQYFGECTNEEQNVCKGNRHNCIQTELHRIASLSGEQQENIQSKFKWLIP